MLRFMPNLVTGLATAAILMSVPAYASDTPEAIKLRTGLGNPAAGKTKGQLCQGCHGVTGQSIEGLIPAIAGQYSEYLTKQIRNFQTMERTHQIMNAMVVTISEPDLPDIVAYFASQKQMKGDGKGETPQAKNLFLNGDPARDIVACVSCHGENGKGKAPDVSTFPVIGGQNKEYLKLQLNNWRAGERTNSPDNVMNKVTKSLTDAEIEALSNYIAGM